MGAREIGAGAAGYEHHVQTLIAVVGKSAVHLHAQALFPGADLRRGGDGAQAVELAAGFLVGRIEGLPWSGQIQRLNELTGVLARRVVSLGTLSVRGRLQAQLLERAETVGIDDDEALLSPAPRQSDLALMLGTSREEVAREMSRLTRLGLLQREGRNLRICRVDGLRVLLEETR